MDNDEITRSVHIKAAPDRVWRALLDPKEFGTWFRVDLDGPFAVGQTTTGRMTYPGQEGVAWTSVTDVIEPPQRLVFRWPHTGPGENVGPDTLWTTVSFTLEPQRGGTLVTVTESGFADMSEDRRFSAMRGNAEGWDIQTGNLKNHVET